MQKGVGLLSKCERKRKVLFKRKIDSNSAGVILVEPGATLLKSSSSPLFLCGQVSRAAHLCSYYSKYLNCNEVWQPNYVIPPRIYLRTFFTSNSPSSIAPFDYQIGNPFHLHFAPSFLLPYPISPSSLSLISYSNIYPYLSFQQRV